MNNYTLINNIDANYLISNYPTFDLNLYNTQNDLFLKIKLDEFNAMVNNDSSNISKKNYLQTLFNPQIYERKNKSEGEIIQNIDKENIMLITVIIGHLFVLVEYDRQMC